MRIPPPNAPQRIWDDFQAFADAHAVPHEAEDWQYLWDCFLAGSRAGQSPAFLANVGRSDGQLKSYSPAISWTPGNILIYLSGSFDTAELRTLACFVEAARGGAPR